MKKICIKKSIVEPLSILVLLLISTGVYLKATYKLTNETSTLKTRAEAAKTANKIFNGERVKPNEYPSYVRIYLIPTNSDISVCGGVLVSENWVLTAAHCTDVFIGGSIQGRIELLIGVDDYTKDDKKVLGRYHYNIPIKDIEAFDKIIFTPQVVEITDVKDNMAYTRFYRPDIALIKLPYSAKNVPIYSLPPLKKDKLVINDGTRMTAIGTGAVGEPKSSTDNTSYSANYLNKVIMVINNELNIYKEKYKSYILRLESYKNSGNLCGGDSGGPILYMKWERPYIVGIISIKGSGCTDNLKINDSYFVSVREFLDWIIEITGITPEFGTINERIKIDKYPPQVELGTFCNLMSVDECAGNYAICVWSNNSCFPK